MGLAFLNFDVSWLVKSVTMPIEKISGPSIAMLKTTELLHRSQSVWTRMLRLLVGLSSPVSMILVCSALYRCPQTGHFRMYANHCTILLKSNLGIITFILA